MGMYEQDGAINSVFMLPGDVKTGGYDVAPGIQVLSSHESRLW